MQTVVTKLLPYAPKGLLYYIKDNILICSGLEGDLKALESELERDWLTLAREEALLRIRDGLNSQIERIRPPEFHDLVVKLNLGRLNEAGRELLNAFYGAVEALQVQADTLRQAVDKARSVAALNKIDWPDWVSWEPLPSRLKIELEIR